MALWSIFNAADVSIFVGVAIILLFQNRFFHEDEPADLVEPSPISASPLENR